jgi:Leucine-rich repeat (LRR) protein
LNFSCPIRISAKNNNLQMQDDILKIQALIHSGTEANIALALSLAEGLSLDATSLLAPWLELRTWLLPAKRFRYKPLRHEAALWLEELFQVKYISLYDLETDYLPEAIGDLPLKSIDGRWSDIQKVPTSVAHLKEIKKLNLGVQKFEELPDWLVYWEQIEELDLRANLLKQLPAYISELKQLKVLKAFSNQIKEIEDAFFFTSRLERLYLWDNKLESISGKIAYLKNLEVLNLRSNSLESLPDSIGELKQLRILDLYDNEIELLPASILEMSNLQKLNIKNNPISKHQITALIHALPNCHIVYE